VTLQGMRLREPAWVDLGDGTAVDASLIWWIGVAPPQPLSWCFFPTIEPDRRRQWTVSVEDVRHVATTVGRYWDEASARAHARRIVDLMHTAADTTAHDPQPSRANHNTPPKSRQATHESRTPMPKPDQEPTP
jgi:hypothetical protein